MLLSKSRHHFLYNFIVTFLSFFVFKSVLLLGDERPNFVVILCDDLGYGDISCYGNKIIKTPNIDRLASQGIRFTDYYSPSPVCSPSRVGLLTGRTPNRAGIYDWIPSKTQFHLKEDEFTIPKMLKRVGYATCMSGKWHCNGMFNKNDQPQPGDFGFDHWFVSEYASVVWLFFCSNPCSFVQKRHILVLPLVTEAIQFHFPNYFFHAWVKN